MTGDALLSAEGLVAGYSGVGICGPLDLVLPPGESVCLVGTNGAGKSTLLRTLVGRQEPISGTVSFRGAPLEEGGTLWRREAAVMLDDEFFLPQLTVGEHLEAVAVAHGLPDPQAALRTELQEWGIDELRDRGPQSLSSGQRRRMLLAAVFLRPFRLVVLDEPEQRLDHGTRMLLAERLRSCTENGSSVLFSTHDADFLGQLPGRVLEVEEAGTVEVVGAVAGPGAAEDDADAEL